MLSINHFLKNILYFFDTNLKDNESALNVTNSNLYIYSRQKGTCIMSVQCTTLVRITDSRIVRLYEANGRSQGDAYKRTVNSAQVRFNCVENSSRVIPSSCLVNVVITGECRCVFLPGKNDNVVSLLIKVPEEGRVCHGWNIGSDDASSYF